MIGYVMLGSNDIARARTFYDPIMDLFGASANGSLSSDRRVWYAKKKEGSNPMVVITKPYDGKPASVGNGTMVALPVRTREKVDAIHARALALGGADEGKPGLRTEKFYGAYFRDPDGNKLCVFTMVG